MEQKCEVVRKKMEKLEVERRDKLRQEKLNNLSRHLMDEGLMMDKNGTSLTKFFCEGHRAARLRENKMQHEQWRQISETQSAGNIH